MSLEINRDVFTEIDSALMSSQSPDASEVPVQAHLDKEQPALCSNGDDKKKMAVASSPPNGDSVLASELLSSSVPTRQSVSALISELDGGQVKCVDGFLQLLKT